ncbi:MAG: amino acid adenylation domain-containing protein [Frankiaceae bacterium]
MAGGHRDGGAELVTDRPRSRAGTAGTGRVVLDLEPSLGAALADLGRRWAVRPGPLLLAAFAVLLRRYGGQDDVVLALDLVGGTGSTAGRAGTVRLAVDPMAPVRSLAGAAQAATHRLAPADPTGPAPALGLADHPVPQGTDLASDLVLSVGGVDRLHLDFDAALLDRASVERLAGHLRLVLRAIAEAPDRPVRAIDLLAPGERARILREFNATARPYPRDLSVHRAFEDQARRTPERLAVAEGGTRLAYRELDRAADRLAHRLRQAGAGGGRPVGLLVPRSATGVVASLAILKAGGAYLPIDPGYPRERVELLLADSGAGVLVADPVAAQGIRFAGRVVPPADRDAPIEPSADVAATDPAYLIYTSGTTGRPKGVRVAHRGVVRLVRGTDYVPLSEETRTLPTCAAVFDVATFEIWGALLNGGSLHVVPDDVILDAGALGRALAEHRITTMWLTAPLFNQLVEQDPGAFRPLRHLLVGGDALSARHVAKAMDACPGVTIVNGYGPTEGTTFATTHRLDRDDLDRIPIGRPIANSTAYVVDADGGLCPVGVPGELCLGGDGVAIGYHERPELTARAFVPDPYAPGGTMYRTGDVARWRPDGVLDFLGRRDHQVKVRGFRIELGEIEQALLGHPGVREAVVLARERAVGDRYLCGYYAPAGEVTPAEARAHLAGSLPDHMVPPFLLALDALPLNASGKVDRAQLPDPLDRTGEPAASVPAGGVEGELSGLVERTLGVRASSNREQLADLGADSLTATLLASAIEQAFGRRIPVRGLLGSATLESIARRLATAEPLRAAIPRAPDRPTYPVAPQQRRVHVEQCKDESATHYNVPVAVELPPGADADRLVTALYRLVERHDALRTEIVVLDGEARQRIRDPADVPIEVTVGTADGHADGQPPIDALVRPFDLARAPLWRAAIHRTGERLRLFLDLHHVITDGLSIGVLLVELAALHDDPSGRTLPDPGLRYRDYADWMAGPQAAAAVAAQRVHWHEVLAVPQPRNDLPIDMPRSPVRSPDGGNVEFAVDADRAAALRRLARREDGTLFGVLAALHGALLAGLTGAPDVTVGTPVSGRGWPGVERTLGMFANTVCLRSTARPELPFAAYLREVGRVAQDAFDNQDVPFEEVVAPARRDYSRNPLFDALIALHSERYLTFPFAGERVPIRLCWNGGTPFDLNMQIRERADALDVSWQYASRLFHRSSVEALRDGFLALIDAVLAAPGVPVGELGALAGSARPAAVPVPDLDFDL